MREARELGGFCYHAARGFQEHLITELGDCDRVDGELVTVLGERRRAWWTRNIWTSPLLIEFSSVGDAAKKLPVWLHEGLAVYGSGEGDDLVKRYVAITTGFSSRGLSITSKGAFKGTVKINVAPRPASFFM